MARPGQEIEIQVPRLDGGYNSKDSPANIAINESPDCLNVIYSDRGAAETRLGSAYLNTETVGTLSCVIDGMASYNGTLCVWAGGTLWRMSGTTFVTVGSAQSVFTAGVKVAHVVYQGMLIHSSEGTGPFRYQGASDFYRLGIGTPSAPTAACNVSGTDTGPPTGIKYYKIAYRNTSTVEGEPGSYCVSASCPTAAMYISSIPIAEASLGVAARVVYRASTPTGPYRMVGIIADNTTGVYTDTVGTTTWSVSPLAVEDASSLPAFTTVKEHQGHLWVPDSDDAGDKSLIRYSDYGVPYISQAENFFTTDEGSGDNIIAIGVQDSIVTAFKSNSIWLVDPTTPGSPETYQCIKSPANLGIVGPRAFCETDNGIIFVGKRNGRITGVHLLSGTRVAQTSDSKLRTESISERLERDILALSKTYWSDICMTNFNNQILMAYTDGTYNDKGFWFDVNRLGSEGQPGSWSPWDGLPTKVRCYCAHSDGNLYGGSSIADAYVIQINKSLTYNDAGGAIDSYWWSKQLGGEEVESWFKDWHRLNAWYSLEGNWNMKVALRADGSGDDSGIQYINLDPGGATWDVSLFGSAYFGGAADDETQLRLGRFLSRRISVGFSNENAADQSFKVYRFGVLGTLRRIR